MISACFADTFFFLALLDKGDDAHDAAVSFITGFSGRMITTEWILTELGDAYAGPADRNRFVAFIRSLRSKAGITIVRSSGELEQKRKPKPRSGGRWERLAMTILVESSVPEFQGPIRPAQPRIRYGAKSHRRPGPQAARRAKPTLIHGEKQRMARVGADKMRRRATEEVLDLFC